MREGQGRLDDRSTVTSVLQGANTTARQIGALAPMLRGQGVDPLIVNGIGDLARQLQGGAPGARDEQLNRQLQTTLTLLEQLEQKLSRAAPGNGRAAVRGAATEPLNDENRDAVAEYYRELSKK